MVSLLDRERDLKRDTTFRSVPRLKALGLISEIISWKLRLFIPTGAQGPAMLASLLDRHTLVGVTDRAATA